MCAYYLIIAYTNYIFHLYHINELGAYNDVIFVKFTCMEAIIIHVLRV